MQKVSILKHYLPWFLRSSLVAALIAFVGICLWIFVLTGAASLPAWLYAIWWIVSLVLTVYMLFHWAMYLVDYGKDDAIGAGIAVPVIVLGATAMFLPLGGPGLASTVLFLFLASMTGYDAYLSFQARYPQQAQASEQVAEQGAGE